MTTSPTMTAINADNIESTRHIRTRTASESVTSLVAMTAYFPSSRPLDYRSSDQELVAPVTNVTQFILRFTHCGPVSRNTRIVTNAVHRPGGER